MNDTNALIGFLYNHPWSSASTLELVFGPEYEKLVRSKETRHVEIPGIGTCWSVRHEKLSSIPGTHRREQARSLIVRTFGKDTLWQGGSPGPWGSDLLARCGNAEGKYWIRAWIDNEGPGVEALPFFHPVPSRFAPNLVDLIVTQTVERAELIKRQLHARWGRGTKNAMLYSLQESTSIQFRNGPGAGGFEVAGPVLESEEVQKALTELRWKRLENIRHEQSVGKVFLALEEIDFELIRFVGDNPLFSPDDLALLVTSGETGAVTAGEVAQARHRAKARFTSLCGKGLCENAAPPIAGIKVSDLGLEVLAKYWGVSQDSMRRFHAWPQIMEEKAAPAYSEKALNYIKDHTHMVQRFVFGLLDNAWRLHEEHGGVDVSLDTIIGKRIYFQNLSSGEYGWVIPDASIDISFWRKSWIDGRVDNYKNTFANARLLLELDRGTVPPRRLEKRIQQYGRIWRSLSGNPVQLWVIDGSPWREKEILLMLEEAGVNGWTVLMERLVLEQNDPWWVRHSHKFGVLAYTKHRGMAPLRKIWRRAGDYELHHLLDHSPWAREMSQTKPMISVPRGY